jgi:hypothetical protein
MVKEGVEIFFSVHAWLRPGLETKISTPADDGQGAIFQWKKGKSEITAYAMDTTLTHTTIPSSPPLVKFSAFGHYTTESHSRAKFILWLQ